MSTCKDCGESVEIYESASKDQQIIGIGRRCGEPIQPEVPGECGEAIEHVSALGTPVDPVMAEALEIIAMKTEPQVGDDVIFPDGHEEKIVSVGHIGHAPQMNFMVQAMEAEKLRPKGPDFCVVTPEDIAAHGGSLLAEDYIGEAGKSKRMKLHFHYMPHGAAPKLFVAYDAPKRAGNPVPKEKPRVVRMPDGTEYEMRHSGLLRVSSRRCEQKEYDFHNNSTRRRLA
jgi:hypothetical protein